MRVTRGYKTELDLNNVQTTACLMHAGAARYAYNWGLKRYQEEYVAGRKTPNATSLHKELNALKQTELFWMYEVSKCAPQEALRNLEKAFKSSSGFLVEMRSTVSYMGIDACGDCRSGLGGAFQVKRRSLKQEPNTECGLSMFGSVSDNGCYNETT